MAVIKSFCFCCTLRSGSMFVAVYSLLSSAFYVALLLIRNVGYRFVETSTVHAVVTYGTFGVFGLLAILAVGLIVGVYRDKKWLFIPWLIQTLVAHVFATVTVVWLVVVTIQSTETTSMMLVEDLATNHTGNQPAAKQLLHQWEIGILCYHAVNLVISAYCVLCVLSQMQELLSGRGTRHRRRERRRRQLALFFNDTNGDTDENPNSPGGNGNNNSRIAPIISPPPYCEKPPPYSTFPRGHGVDPPRDYDEGSSGNNSAPVVPNAARTSSTITTSPATSGIARNDREQETVMSSAYVSNHTGTEAQEVTLVIDSAATSYATMPNMGTRVVTRDGSPGPDRHRATGRPDRPIQPNPRETDSPPPQAQGLRRVGEIVSNSHDQAIDRQIVSSAQGDVIMRNPRDSNPPRYNRFNSQPDLSATDAGPGRTRDISPSRDQGLNRRRDLSPSRNHVLPRSQDLPIRPSRERSPERPRGRPRDRSPENRRDVSPKRRREYSPPRNKKRNDQRQEETQHPGSSADVDLGRPREEPIQPRSGIGPPQNAYGRRKAPGPGRKEDRNEVEYSAVHIGKNDRRRVLDHRAPALRADTRPRDNRLIRPSRDPQAYPQGISGPYVGLH